MQPQSSQFIDDARAFATWAHAGQVRKYTNEPYVRHVEAVAAAVARLPGATEFDVVIALLHDVVEDTPVTFTDLQRRFGAVVTQGVFWLTDTDNSLGNRETRKMLDRVRLAAAPRNIQNIKLCDLIDNSSSIMEHDPEFGERYMGEKLLLLRQMNRGDDTLWNEVFDLIQKQPFFSQPSWRSKYDPPSQAA